MQLPAYITDDNEMAVWPGVPEPERVERAITLVQQMNRADDASGVNEASGANEANGANGAGPAALRDAEHLRQRIRNEYLRTTLQSDSWGKMTPAALFDLAVTELASAKHKGFDPRKELVIATLDQEEGHFTMSVTTVPENKGWMGFDPAYRRLKGGTGLIMLRQRSTKRTQGMMILPECSNGSQDTPSGKDSAAELASLARWHGGAVQVVPHSASN